MSLLDISREKNKTDFISNFTRNNVPPDKHFQYALLQAKHVDEVVKIFTQAFCDSEPMTAYLMMDKKRYAIFARAVTEKALQDGFSVVALDHGKVIACALVEDLADVSPPPDFDPKFRFIVALLDQLGVAFFSGKQFPKRHIAHLFITAVDANYRHLGLSTQVNFKAMDLAAKHQFDFVYCEFTHFFNEKGTIEHLKNHKRFIGSVIYNEFVCEGIKPFANLPGRANSYLWEIHPGAQLTYTSHGIQHKENW